MPSYYAEQQVLGSDGQHVSNRLLPICDTITKLGEKINRNRESFPLKEGQQFADRIYVYRVHSKLLSQPIPHGIYVFEGGKLKRKKRMYFVEGVVEARDFWNE